MKLSTASLLMALGTASSFSPSSVQFSQTSSTRLGLFGGGDKKAGGGGGIIDQMAMFKKAQELAQQKKKLDAELAATDFEGIAEDGKVKASIEFVPMTSPTDPNPDYMATGFEFDDEWYEAASPEELSAAVMEAIKDGTKTANQAVIDKYENLQGALMGTLAAGMGEGGDEPAAAES